VRVVLWYWGRRGGGARFTRLMAQALAARRDIDLSLAVAAGNETLAELRRLDRPMHVTRTYAGPGSFALSLPRAPFAARTLAAEARGADAVVSMMAHLWTPFGAMALRRAGTKLVSFVHDADPHPGEADPLWRWRQEAELTRAAAAVALSPHVAARVAARHPRLPLHRMELGDVAPAATQDPAAPFLLFGRLRAYKGLDVLADALDAMPDPPRIRIVGQGPDSPALARLAAHPAVTLERRWVPEAEVPHLVAGARAIVLPYTEASQSGVVALAMAAGVPVLATRVGGIQDQFSDDVEGLQVMPTASAFAEGLRRMRDPALRDRLAAGARARGAALADFAAHADRLLAIVRTLR
jgi:glycosyltransferase involved in cell wall biosynthesis